MDIDLSSLRPDEIAGLPAAPHSDDWRPILPVPDDAPEVTCDLLDGFAPRGFRRSGAWRYPDAEGRMLGCTVRFDRPANGHPAEKQVLPVTYCEGRDGHRAWRAKGFPTPRPLYGLDRLARRPDAPVLVVEGEKTATAAAKRFSGHVVTTSPGGSKAAGKADWSPIRGREVTVWPDADEPGAGYAADVARLVAEAGAASVAVVTLPDGLPKGWDLADDLPEEVTEVDLARLLVDASAPKVVSVDGPLPLFPPLPPATPYPVNALGPFLGKAALSIAAKVQVPIEIAAQSVLAASALAVQAHADVKLPFGQIRPTSLDFVTVAASGDRKSSADNEALWPIRQREKVLREHYEDDMKAWRIDFAAWSAQRKKIEAEGKLDYEGRRAKLEALGDEPRKPLAPILTTGDATLEGLTKNWPWMHGALGLFSAEGGQFTGGYGMKDENRLNTAAALSLLWDGRDVPRLRAMDGISALYGRRLSVHLMIQPDAAASFLADPTLRDQGLLSRILVAAPASIAGTRFYRQPSAEDEAVIKRYGARLLSLLETPPKTLGDAPNELAPRVLILDTKATAIWKAFFDHVERQCGTDGDLRPILDFAAKAAEHAARLAGVVAMIEKPDTNVIDGDAMECGIGLADWYVGEALRLAEASRTDTRLLKAQSLLDWLRERHDDEVPFREILQFGPNTLRTKTTAEEAVSILIAHGWLRETEKRPRRLALVSEAR